MARFQRLAAAILTVAMAHGIMMAVPAKPVPFTHRQSDGSTVTLVMQGGELHRSMVTTDGLMVARDDRGDYCYVAGGNLSNVIAHDRADRGIEEQAFVVAYREQMTQDAAPRRTPKRESENTNPQVPTVGSPRIPIILANYSDVKFLSADPVPVFEDQFNQMEYSCLHYFESQSRGQFDARGKRRSKGHGCHCEADHLCCHRYK